MRIAIVLFDGFDELDALAPYEVLQRAAELGAAMQVALVSSEAVTEVTGFYGTSVRVQGQLTLAERPDLLIVPGGGWNHAGGRGARQAAQTGDLPRLLAAIHHAGTRMAGVCTGTMLLATAGLLRERPATTHHLATEELAALGATVIAARVVDADDIITAAGVTSGLDLALWLVERFADPDLAARVEQRMEYERRGTVWR